MKRTNEKFSNNFKFVKKKEEKRTTNEIYYLYNYLQNKKRFLI